jgi:glycosyltransferase involved in cell wall biosynthesis
MKKTVVLSFSITHGSVSDYFINLATKLSSIYHVIVISDKKSSNETKLINHGIQVCYWPSVRPTKWRDFLFLYKLLKNNKPVMTISIFGSVNICLLVGFLLGVKNRIAWSRTLTSQFPQNRMNIFRKKIIYKLATQLITNSNATKQDLNTVFSVPLKKITTLYNSVKAYNVKSTCIENNKIVYVGRLHESKGIDTLIEAVYLLKHLNIILNLDIIGTGSEKDKLDKLVIKFNLENQVSFLGNKSKEDVLLALKKSYCAIIPSKSEAFGYTVIEAMSMQTCVIGANNTGIKEIILDEQSGLLFKTSDAHDLAQKIKKIFLDLNYRNELALNGYNRFLNEFELDKAIQRDFNYFNKLITNV